MRGKPHLGSPPILLRRGLAVGLAVVLGGCGGGSPADPGGDPLDPSGGVLRGVALSPAGFPEAFSQLNAFFDEVAGFGRGAVMWNGAWRDDAVDGTDAGTLPVAAGILGDAADGGSRFAPVAVFGWRSEQALFIRLPADPTNDWSNAAARAAFRNVVREFASAYHPALLFLGNESDFYAAQDPADGRPHTPRRSPCTIERASTSWA